MQVVVLDGEQRAALAIARSLGRRGMAVSIGSASGSALAAASRYCREHFRYPTPYTSPDDFLEAVSACLGRYEKVLLLPLTDVSCGVILEHREALGRGVRLPLGAYEAYWRLSNKVRLFETAEKLGIPVPRTVAVEVSDSDRLLRDCRVMDFPLVIKPFCSRIPCGNGWIDAGVRYARDEAELRSILESDPFRSFPFLVQERIVGSGMGVCLLAKDGEVLVHFAHRRLREKPPWGGVSVLCESIEPPAVALEAARVLVREVNWTGVAMVEFKEDRRDGVPKLIEVNARFWGSLQLAISAGVDFPYLLYQLATGERISGSDNYRRNLKLRWILGDLDHLLIRLRRNALELDARGRDRTVPKMLLDFVRDFFDPAVRNEVWTLSDPVPGFLELRNYLADILARR